GFWMFDSRAGGFSHAARVDAGWTQRYVSVDVRFFPRAAARGPAPAPPSDDGRTAGLLRAAPPAPSLDRTGGGWALQAPRAGPGRVRRLRVVHEGTAAGRRLRRAAQVPRRERADHLSDRGAQHVLPRLPGVAVGPLAPFCGRAQARPAGRAAGNAR